MASYNSAEYLGEAVDSVISQTFGDWQLIISDDGSSDGSPDIAKAAMAKDDRIHLIAGATNRGPARARNAAIELAQGRYIAFLDSDDFWKPNKLERQIDFMRQEQVAFSFSSYDRISEDGERLGTVSVRSPVNYRDLLLSNVIGCLTAVYDTERLGKMLMPDVRKRQDFALWLNILKKVDYAHPLPDVLATYRVRRRSVSSNKLVAAAHTWRIYREVERLPLHLAVYYFANYAVRGALSRYGRPGSPGA